MKYGKFIEVHSLTGIETNVSSTNARKATTETALKQNVTDEVATFIMEHKLYSFL